MDESAAIDSIASCAARAQQLADGEEPLVRRTGDDRFELGIAPLAQQAGERLAPEVETAHRFEQRGRKGSPDAHRFAGRLHLRADRRVGEGNLSNGQRGIFTTT